MDDGDRPDTPDDSAPEPRPCRWKSPVELWLSEDPWDREVLENIDELAWQLGELRAMGDRLRGWARLR